MLDGAWEGDWESSLRDGEREIDEHTNSADLQPSLPRSKEERGGGWGGRERRGSADWGGGGCVDGTTGDGGVGTRSHSKSGDRRSGAREEKRGCEARNPKRTAEVWA
jgi:hypothetical protein